VKRKNKIAPNVMMKIWLSSRRSLRNTLKRRSSQKETRSPKPQPREHAKIVVRMITLLLIVPLSIGMKVTTRRSTSHIRRTRATKEMKSLTKRSPMVMLTSGKNGSSKMREPTLIVTVWQPWLSRESLFHVSLSSQSSIKRSTSQRFAIAASPHSRLVRQD
jgi:hypothetical protein